jgi:F0F1-type ATP synthase delta subunit
MQKLSDLKKIINKLVETYPDMELDVVYRCISDSERIAKLEGVIQELIEFVEKYSDVVDGDEGQPEPNHAMSLVTMAQDVLEGKYE